MKLNETKKERNKKMKKKILAALTAGILTTGLLTGNVFAADTEVKGDENLKGEVYAFIAASLSNSMEEIQKDFNELYPILKSFIRRCPLSTMQTVQAHFRLRLRAELLVIFSFQQQINRWMPSQKRN